MKKIIIATVVLAILLLAGCAKDDTVTLRPVVNKTVSFQKDLIPLFTKNCALSGCHADGGHAPYLASTKAYASLTSGGFVNVGSPEKSIVYEHLIGTLSPAMPMGGTSNPGNINGYVLAWIQQGAKNN